MRKIFAALGACSLLAACSYYEEQAAASRARTAMIGQSKEQVLACAGAPVSRAQEGNTEAWTFSSAGGSSGAAVPVGGIYAFAGSQHACTVRVIFTSGAVSAVRYQSSGYIDTPDYVCGQIVRACAPPR